MRNFDLSPLYRSTVGFDRLFSLIDQISDGTAPTYPPYNIEKASDSTYRIVLAVAGFAEDELTLHSEENLLIVTGSHKAPAENGPEFLFRGIAARDFERRFQLADYVSVTGARLENGLLHIELKREVPEAKKPRQIAIESALLAAKAKTPAKLAA